MRRKNKKLKKHSRFATSSMGFAALVVTGFTMLMIYRSLDSRCTAIAQEIGKVEKHYQQLDQEAVREAARWNEMTTPEKLEEKLTRFGLEMNLARADQWVHMNADGRPQPGQISVARARSRAMTLPIVDATSSIKKRVRPLKTR